MCRQYLCLICDRPLTGHGFFQNCEFNPDARPPWLQQWVSRPQCYIPAYAYSDTCHVICNQLKLQAQVTIQQQLGIAAVVGRPDGFVDWQRSPYSTLSEQEMMIPQATYLLLGQPPRSFHFGHPANARETVSIPTEGFLEAHRPSGSVALERLPILPTPMAADRTNNNPYAQNLTPNINNYPYAQDLSPNMNNYPYNEIFTPNIPNANNNPYNQLFTPNINNNPDNHSLTAPDQQLMEWENEEEDHQPLGP